MAERFDWHESYELGVELLDVHHRQLMVLAAEVARRAEGHAPRAELEAALEALTSFTAAHFAAEERAMVEAGFDDTTHHHEQHGELLGQLRRFGARLLRERSREDIAKTLTFLSKWVVHHILHSDRKFAEHLSFRGEPAHAERT